MRSRRERGVLVAALLLAGAVGLALVRELWRDRDTDPTATSTSRPNQQREAPCSPAAPVETPRVGSGVAAAAPAGPPAPTRTLEEPPPARRSTFVVHVVDAKTREPLADVDVHWAMDYVLEARRPRGGAREDLWDVDETLRQYGFSAQSDARGDVRCARARGLASFLAEDATRWASKLHVRLESVDDVELALSSDDCVRVQVVDADDHPIPDVAVAFGARGFNVGQQSRRGVTRAPDGIALITDLGRYMRMFSADRRDWSVSLLVPCLLLPSELVDPQRPLSDPIRLRLPATGSMAFSFVGRDGEPCRDEFRVLLQALPRRNATTQGWTTCFAREMPVSGGRLVLPYVGVGLELMLDGDVANEPILSATPLEGPMHFGERIEQTLKVEVGPIHFLGRAVDSHGDPVAGANVDVVGGSAPSSASWAVVEKPAVKTDADGRFDVVRRVVGRLSRVPSVPFTIQLRRSDGSQAAMIVTTAAVADGRTLNVGDVAFHDR